MTTSAAPPSKVGRGRIIDFVGRYGILVAFILVLLQGALLSDRFVTLQNVRNLLDQAAPLGILAAGVTIAIIGGVFDLSTAATFALAAVVAAKLGDVDPLIAILAGIAVGPVMGLINAGILSATGVNSFIGTLTTSVIFRGIGLLVTGGLIVGVADPTFRTLGTGTLFSVKYSAYLFIGVSFICAILLRRTVFGREVIAVGANPEAARLVGVRVGWVRAGMLMVSGACAAIAGVLTATRTGSAQADQGAGFELAAIVAVVVGGTSIFGGEGAVWRTVLGVLLLQVIGNVFNLVGIDPLLRQVAQGVLILAAITIDHIGRRKMRGMQ